MLHVVICLRSKTNNLSHCLLHGYFWKKYFQKSNICSFLAWLPFFKLGLLRSRNANHINNMKYIINKTNDENAIWEFTEKNYYERHLKWKWRTPLRVENYLEILQQTGCPPKFQKCKKIWNRLSRLANWQRSWNTQRNSFCVVGRIWACKQMGYGTINSKL